MGHAPDQKRQFTGGEQGPGQPCQDDEGSDRARVWPLGDSCRLTLEDRAAHTLDLGHLRTHKHDYALGARQATIQPAWKRGRGQGGGMGTTYLRPFVGRRSLTLLFYLYRVRSKNQSNHLPSSRSADHGQFHRTALTSRCSQLRRAPLFRSARAILFWPRDTCVRFDKMRLRSSRLGRDDA